MKPGKLLIGNHQSKHMWKAIKIKIQSIFSLQVWFGDLTFISGIKKYS
jgi:hypothetical protein